MKKLFIFFLFLIFSLTAISAFVYFQTRPVGSDSPTKFFLITKGMSASEVAINLKKTGFIKSTTLFKIYIRLSNLSNKIQAGQYKLSSSYSLFKTISEINKGPIQVWVTIPEGLKNDEVADKFIKVLSPVDQSDFKDEFLNLSKIKQGYLFPETYLFPYDATPSMIINKMLLTFEKKVGDISYEKLIMASIVEEETKTDLERPIVAGILFKRLRAGWPLQVDVALETYDKIGLPKSPIANPGLASIKAAQNPETSPFWFYLHDSEGNIHYGRTIEEHNENIRKYLK